MILRFASPWLVHTALKVPIAIQSETLSAFRYVAISLPVVISLAGLRGFIGAYQRFDLLSVVRVPISLFSYLIPLGRESFFQESCTIRVGTRVFAVLSMVHSYRVVFSRSPNRSQENHYGGRTIPPHVQFGGW